MPSTAHCRIEKQTVRHVFNGDGYRHLPDVPSVCYMVYKNVNQAATQYYRHRKSLFICKKRWTMTLLRAGGTVAGRARRGESELSFS